MANHYLLVGVASRDFDRERITPVDDEFFEYDGTIYAEEIRQLNKVTEKADILTGRFGSELGDGEPAVVQLVVAHNAPNPKDLAAINAKLCEIFFLKQIAWVGHDPADCSVQHLIETEEPKTFSDATEVKCEVN